MAKEIKNYVVCSNCKGNGFKDGDVCPKCKGSGMLRKKSFPGKRNFKRTLL